jgi:exopolysaccharide biosynthesis WecB/TagA/CpsF family protein
MISLIVCTLGRIQTLERLFASLRAQSDRAFEVVLVDQNPCGFVAPLLDKFRDLPIAYQRSEPGLSRARNAGLRQARGQIVGFPDDDCWYGLDVVRQVSELFSASPKLGFVSGRTVDVVGVESVSAHLPMSADITIGNVFQAGNSNTLFVRADVARQAGGFDEELGAGAAFGSGEETDFILRCREAGYSGRYQHELVVFHDQVEASPALRIARAGRYAPGFGRVVRLHNLGVGFLAGSVGRALARSALLFVSGERAGAQERLVWAQGASRGFLASMRSRSVGSSKLAVLGIKFSPLRRGELAQVIANESIPLGSGLRAVVTANVDHVVQIARRPEFSEAYERAWVATADGMPVYLYASLRGAPVRERVTGCDLVADVIGSLRPDRHCCFFVVSSDIISVRLSEYLRARGFHPDALAACVPPFGFERDCVFSAELARRIREHGTTHLFMGVGAPKSETWTDAQRHRLGDCYVLSVGAALDYFVGARTRAPIWMQKTGFEWLWRFLHEPVRLFPRYFIASWGFLVAVRDDLLRQ